MKKEWKKPFVKWVILKKNVDIVTASSQQINRGYTADELQNNNGDNVVDGITWQ